MTVSMRVMIMMIMMIIIVVPTSVALGRVPTRRYRPAQPSAIGQFLRPPHLHPFTAMRELVHVQGGQSLVKTCS